MSIPEISLSQMLGLMEEYVCDRVLALARKPVTTHLVYFENYLLDSSHCGESGVVAVGPNNTLNPIADVEGKWLNDLPSQQQYPLLQCERARCPRRESVPGMPVSHPRRMVHARLPRGSYSAMDLLRRCDHADLWQQHFAHEGSKGELAMWFGLQPPTDPTVAWGARGVVGRHGGCATG